METSFPFWNTSVEMIRKLLSCASKVVKIGHAADSLIGDFCYCLFILLEGFHNCNTSLYLGLHGG